MRFGLTMIAAAVLCLGLAAISASAGDGPDIGTQAPRFTLKDQNGKERSLDDLLKNGKVALVFFRSAGW